MTYEECVRYLYDIPRFTQMNDLCYAKELLRRLKHPEESFEVIHVAGTNGKGSVCAFLEAILRRAGFRTGLFTSPHLVRINERFQVMRQEITDEEFCSCFHEIRQTADEMEAEGWRKPTFFEMLFAIGMLYFKQQKIEILILETGLGGRLDATNAIGHPVLSVITSISRDHTKYLGDTIAQISSEKAGIIKEGIPVVFDASDPQAERVIRDSAKKMHAPAIAWYPQMSETSAHGDKSIDFVINNRYYDYVCVSVPFPADYQTANASLAMIAVKVLAEQTDSIVSAGILTDQQITEAICNTRWSGRMEVIAPGVILDGAHNADGIGQLVKTIRTAARTMPVSLLFTAVSDKEYETMIEELCCGIPYRSITATQINGDRCVPAGELAEVFRKYSQAEIRAVSDVKEAYCSALAHRGDSLLFCAGSLYLIGEIEALNREFMEKTRC